MNRIGRSSRARRAISLVGLLMMGACGSSPDYREAARGGAAIFAELLIPDQAAVAFGDGKFVSVGERGIYVSGDGIRYEQRAEAVHPRAVAYGNGRWVVADQPGTGFTSADGLTWSATTLPEGIEIFGATFDGERFVLVGSGGSALLSQDGLEWSVQHTATTEELRGVVYGDGQLVAVGRGGAIVTSDDGVDWQARTSGTDNGLSGIAHGDGSYLAVGDYGTMLSSWDGITWEPVESGSRLLLAGVYHSLGRFVVVGTGETILVSEDGLSSRAVDAGLSELPVDIIADLYAVTYGNGFFVAVGDVPVRSTDGEHWVNAVTSDDEGDGESAETGA